MREVSGKGIWGPFGRFMSSAKAPPMFMMSTHGYKEWIEDGMKGDVMGFGDPRWEGERSASISWTSEHSG